MTNHPNRKRDEENEPTIEEMVAEAVEPLAAELREKLTPAHGNGIAPGLRANAAKMLGQAIAATLAESLSESLPQAMYSALAAQRPPCATCVIQRVTWENLHRAEMDTAMAAAAQAGQQDIAPFLPPGLRPGEQGGIPNVTQSITAFQGTELCVAHLGDAAGIRPGKSPLLVATATVPGKLTG